MRAAFRKRSGGWAKAVKDKAKEMKLERTDPKAEEAVALDRDGERLALIEWIASAEDRKKEYDNDAHPFSDKLVSHPISSEFLLEKDEKEGKKTYAKVRTIIEVRCVRCHSESASGSASQYPLDNWEHVELYLEKEKGTGMSLPKLAQTSHVHLLGFSMLWGLTGLIFAFTSYPGWIRLLIAPLALIAQMVDISFWWLARVETHGPMFAQAIMVSGGVVGLALAVQILGGLFNLFGAKGKVIVAIILLVAAGIGAKVYHDVIDPYLKAEELAAAVKE
jgi:hypothetical protein